VIIPIVYGVILAVVHFFNDEFQTHFEWCKNRLVSLGAGIAVAYIFLYMFPELFKITNGETTVFILVLIGFTLFHVVEKHVYQHKSTKRILKELKEVHSIAFFIYHFLIGVTLFYFASGNFTNGLVFFIPIFIHALVSNLSLSEIHEHIRESLPFRIFLALASLLGVLLASFVPISLFAFSLILAFVIGMLLYVVVRDSIPKKTDGVTIYFILGAMIMLGLLVLTA
jgi:hypothetical protein